MEKEKIFTIVKQKVMGKPQFGFQNIAWYDFLFDAQLETETEINQCALALLRGEWLFYNGSSYYIEPSDKFNMFQTLKPKTNEYR